mmetsp:Transcript_16519/g.18674  ORF Transcript_16519/g.18674 Transcript_16519/m.18674 type:complete len:277 (+) Transcript_16519:154-984(+)|eukprot:CAMPEP_0184019278 /NCGR_PEP_ID=MMETSP0954-20121128/8656_1 /TAXON_ID=627963 /ORGANISM="Aplanochytrium sp, Strain PBS07" /LENGTH=276 /DNA_ID=CAMNT_0026300913 /DNA_START=483 /DNA_END=1313 /DNA_ORIENTATION=+
MYISFVVAFVLGTTLSSASPLDLTPQQSCSRCCDVFASVDETKKSLCLEGCATVEIADRCDTFASQTTEYDLCRLGSAFVQGVEVEYGMTFYRCSMGGLMIIDKIRPPLLDCTDCCGELSKDSGEGSLYPLCTIGCNSIEEDCNNNFVLENERNFCSYGASFMNSLPIDFNEKKIECSAGSLVEISVYSPPPPEVNVGMETDDDALPGYSIALIVVLATFSVLVAFLFIKRAACKKESKASSSLTKKTSVSGLPEKSIQKVDKDFSPQESPRMTLA